MQGVIAAVPTPLKDDRTVDYGAFERHLDYLIASKVDGILVAGSVGEGPFLKTREKADLLRVAKDCSGRNVKICAGCLGPSTESVVDEVLKQAELEPDYVVAVAPYYFGVSQASIFYHFEEIARRSPVPVIVYNIPRHTHNPIDLETLHELSLVKNIAGVKDSTGDFKYFYRSRIEAFPPDFLWFQGDDMLIGPSLVRGATGLVSGLVGLWPEPFVRIFREARRGNILEVESCQRDISNLFGILKLVECDAITVIKKALELLGWCSALTKLRSKPLTEEKSETIRRALKRLGLEHCP